MGELPAAGEDYSPGTVRPASGAYEPPTPADARIARVSVVTASSPCTTTTGTGKCCSGGLLAPARTAPVEPDAPPDGDAIGPDAPAVPGWRCRCWIQMASIEKPRIATGASTITAAHAMASLSAAR